MATRGFRDTVYTEDGDNRVNVRTEFSVMSMVVCRDDDHVDSLGGIDLITIENRNKIGKMLYGDIYRKSAEFRLKLLGHVALGDPDIVAEFDVVLGEVLYRMEGNILR